MDARTRVWTMLREVETGYTITDLNNGEVFTADNMLDALLYVVAIQARADKSVIRDLTCLMRAIRVELRKSAVINYTGLSGVMEPIAKAAPPENTKGATTGAGICILCGKKTHKNKEKTVSVCGNELNVLIAAFPALRKAINQRCTTMAAQNAHKVLLEDLHGKCAKELYGYLRRTRRMTNNVND